LEEFRFQISEAWKKSEISFRGLEEFGFHFSEGWKNPMIFFQTLEFLRPLFPSIGKIAGRFSRHWKDLFQGLESRAERAPGLAGVWACGLCPAIFAVRCAGETSGTLVLL
jgi:hypothetical protein